MLRGSERGHALAMFIFTVIVSTIFVDNVLQSVVTPRGAPWIDSVPPFHPLRPLTLRRIYTGGLSLGASVSDWDATRCEHGVRAYPARRTVTASRAFETAWRRDETRRNDLRPRTGRGRARRETTTTSAWLRNRSPISSISFHPFHLGLSCASHRRRVSRRESA